MAHTHKELYLSRTGILYFAISSLIQIVITFLYLQFPNHKHISTLCFISVILFIVKFRKSVPLIILFSFFALYVYASFNYFYRGLYVSAHRDFNNALYLNKVLFLNSLFVYTIGNVVSSNVGMRKIDITAFSYKSKYVYFIIYAIGLLMIQFGIKGKNLFESGVYSQGSEKSTLHEYFILAFCILLMVKPKERLYNFLTAGILFIFVAKTLIYGGRIEVLEIVLLYALVKWIFTKKIKNYIIFFITIIGAYINAVITQIRNNPLGFLKGEWISYLNPFYEAKLPVGMPVKQHVDSNQGDVLQASARIVALVDEGIMDVGTRILSFISMLASVFAPSSMLPPYTNLTNYRFDFAKAGGGGLVAASFYVWMGYAGPIIIGIFLGYFINKGFTSNKIGYKVYGLMILVMFPRWYSYNSLLIFKFCFLTVVMYFVFNITYNTLFSKSNALTRN